MKFDCQAFNCNLNLSLNREACALQLPGLGWNTAFFNSWVDGHSADCARLGKPFVLEEFGKNVTVPVTAAGIAAERDPAFQTVYAKLLASLASNGTFQGALRFVDRLSFQEQVLHKPLNPVILPSNGTIQGALRYADRLWSQEQMLSLTLNPEFLASYAGALFWKWALSPPADPTDGLEVGMRDSTFLSYVAPSARAALDTARRASVPGCQTARSRKGFRVSGSRLEGY